MSNYRLNTRRLKGHMTWFKMARLTMLNQPPLGHTRISLRTLLRYKGKTALVISHSLWGMPRLKVCLLVVGG